MPHLKREHLWIIFSQPPLIGSAPRALLTSVKKIFPSATPRFNRCRLATSSLFDTIHLFFQLQHENTEAFIDFVFVFVTSSHVNVRWFHFLQKNYGTVSSCNWHRCDEEVARPSVITGTVHAHPPAPFHLLAGDRPSIRWRLLLDTRPVDSIASVHSIVA